jgi:hypothetical protein
MMMILTQTLTPRFVQMPKKMMLRKLSVRRNRKFHQNQKRNSIFSR